jgi:DNA polymerase (family 10)
MTNNQIAQIFYNIAEILDIQGENPFRIRAYIRAGQTIENLTDQISDMPDIDKLKELPGIGDAILEKIKEVLKTGRLEFYEKLKKSEYAPLIELLKVPGMGPKHVKLVYDQLNIKTIKQLEKAARAGRLRELPGLGPKVEQNILQGIKQAIKHKQRIPLAYVYPYAQAVLKEVEKIKQVKKVILAGSLRRMKETIADIDILVSAEKSKPVIDAFVKIPQVKKVLAKGDTKSSIQIEENIQVDLRVVKPESFGSASHYFTGSKAHNIKIRSIAQGKGLKVNEYGIFKGKKRIAGRTEEEVFSTLGLPYIPPEIREDNGEIEAGFENKLPKLIELKSIKGDLHVHSDWSDGNRSIEQMAKYAKKIGYEYVAICDHSPHLGITNGLDEKRLKKQMKYIDELNKKLKGFVILKGIEVDIKGDGKLDLSDSILEELDIVVASVHTKFSQPEEEMTKRIIKAVENPNVDIIAHPTGRLIGKREPYQMDMDKLMDAVLANGKFLELNAYPVRLDLNDINCRKAKDKGIKIVISTDAHNESELEFMHFGIATARRGWLEKKNVLNTLPFKNFIRYFK